MVRPLASTNVSRIRFRDFFSAYSDFPLSTKTNILKFKFDLATVDERATLWKLLKINCIEVLPMKEGSDAEIVDERSSFALS